ncbi:glyoxylase-like metal-dependent hydrolase (beta-lactamase superfamily II) [Sinobaca qinghaiensis]|uniref:Glyoxylase-like metal-dependent hydrolase (Beta-lactamase superfamily II) n=1 Tax=Sinobaca qinghaiensis TaxID=342944 RepID=A0A419V522_9BACL|nr:MBL fold metallo-hydrolase [Sinobaca qinghaiensis]RKD73583.1 glyoxylase-like metal-dependent hydrolase (beta-lactamase superfamily II) [Sinobaca qinghaiensis]
MPVHYQDQNITVFQSALFQTTSTVAVTEEAVIIVDPTWLPEEIREIQNHVALVSKGRKQYLVFTHSDYDHILGYHAFPEAVTIASRAFVSNSRKEETVEEIKQFDDNYYIVRPYGIEYPYIDIIIDNDEQMIETGSHTLTFYLAPGHNVDGMFILIDHLGVLITGDYLSDVEFPFIYQNSEAYERSLQKVKSLYEKQKINFLIPGHGSVTSSPAEIKDRLDDSLWYIEQLRKTMEEDGEYHVLEAFVDGYGFSTFMKKMHHENIELVKREKDA